MTKHTKKTILMRQKSHSPVCSCICRLIETKKIILIEVFYLFEIENLKYIKNIKPFINHSAKKNIGKQELAIVKLSTLYFFSNENFEKTIYP